MVEKKSEATSELDDFITWLSDHEGVNDLEYYAVYSLYTDYKEYQKTQGSENRKKFIWG